MNMKRRNSIVALLLVVSMVVSMIPMSITKASDNSVARVGEFVTEENTGDMNRVSYNNPSLLTDLDAGMCAYPVVVDMNEDGYMDLLVYGGSVANTGTWIFYGTDDELVMEKGRKLSDGDVITATYLYDDEGNYEKTALHVSGNRNVYDAKDYPITDEDTPIITRDSVNPFQWEEIDGNKNTTCVSSLVSLADFDGDGILDCINSWDSWYEYGWRFGCESRYDENGIWGGTAGTSASNVVGVADGENDEDGVQDGDPLHGWVAWSKNTNTATAQQYGNGTEIIQVYDYTEENGEKAIVEGSARALDVYGDVTTQFWDWDNDGDLDIICGDFVGDLTYFENIGTRTAPVYIEGRPVRIENGEELEMYGHQIVTTAFDWNKDGHIDLIIGEEDGRVHFVENTGTWTADGTPIMKEPVCFQCYSDSLDMGVLASIDSVDWDGDGDEDIIGGNSNGYILLINNLTIEKGGDLENPIWGKAVYLTNQAGEIFRITAGYNGSLQGPSEENFGYTKIDTGDWDGDGVLDIISNNIWGIIMFHKGIKTTDGTFKAENPVPIEVEWSGETPYPSCNWWAPGEETLGVDVTDPAGRFYEAQWTWWNDVKSEDELVVQWRTSPCVIDLPLDKDGDGVAEGDGLMDLVLIDHEGYLSFYERYEENGVLKLKEGQRIFKDTDGTSLLRPCAEDLIDGATGRRQFVLTDYDKDGDLDYIVNNGMNAGYGENVSTVAGTYQFGTRNTVHTRKIAQHVPKATDCDWDGDDYADLLFGDEGGQIYYLKNTIAHPTEEETTTGETLPTDFTRITPADFGIADGTYGNVTTNSNDKPVVSLNKVLFETTVKYDAAYYLTYTDYLNFQTRSAGIIRMFNGFNEAGVWYDGISNANYFDFEPSIALGSNVTTFLGEKYQFAITTEYVDYDLDGNGENDLKIGVWFNGKLYNGKYIYVKNCVDSITTTKLTFSGANEASCVKITSPDLLPDYTAVTLEDFGIVDGTYTTKSYSKTPLDTLDKILLRENVTFNENGTFLYLGNFAFQLRTSGTVLRLWNYYGGDSDTLYINGAAVATGNYFDFSPSTAIGSTDFLDEEMRFAITTAYVDYDGDGNQDDIKIGVWFNEQLYNNKYIYVKDITELIAASAYKFDIAQNGTAGKVTVAASASYEVIVQPTITDSIALNYAVTVDPLLLETGDVSMTFDMNGEDTIKLSEEDLLVEDSVFQYTYTDIMGQDMAEKIIAKLTIGSTVKTFEYSVLDYCVDVLKAETLYESDGTVFSADKLAATKDLVVDLVQYGAALQTYRGVAESKLHTTKLAQKVTNYLDYDLEDDDKSTLANLTAVEKKLTEETTETGAGEYAWQSVGLVLNNKVKIRGTFTASDVANLTVKVTIDGVEKEVAFKATSKAGVYEVDFDEIYAYEYGKQISFRFYEGETQVGKTLNYSVNTYLKEMYTYSDALATLLLAIDNYGDAAIAYQETE